MFKITNDFEGANIHIISIEENTVKVEVDLRDTTEDWFFWCFRVDGAEGKTLRFEFPSHNRVGYFGAAISSDLEHWHWQYEDAGHNGSSFTYTFGATEDLTSTWSFYSSLFFQHG